MRKLLIALVVAIASLVFGGTSAFACTMPTPGGGPAFGQHVSAMSPGQADMMTGSAFGSMVAMMASQGTCDCGCNCLTA